MATERIRTSSVPRRGGRPTRAEEPRRRAHLLKVAGDMFMRYGFDGTSMDAVAEKAGVSKRTLYVRYADKKGLFNAVLRGRIAECITPINRFKSSSGDLETTLLHIGRHLLRSALAPSSVSVHRIIVAEARRQPEFGRLANAEGWRPGVRAIAAVLGRHENALRIADKEAAAAQFMSLVVDNALRMETFGIKTDKRMIEKSVRAAVDLFLNGARA